MKEFIKKLLNKPEELKVYTFMLEHDDEVVGQTPKLRRTLADDVVLELYVVDLKDGNEYAKAVVCVDYFGVKVFSKYDSGRVDGDYKEMIDECIPYIIQRYGLDHFRMIAQDEVEKLSRLDKYLYL